MDNDAPSHRSRSDASRRLFGDDKHDGDPVRTEADAPAQRDDRLFAPPRENGTGSARDRESSLFSRPSPDQASRRPAAGAEPRMERQTSERPFAEPYRSAEAPRNAEPRAGGRSRSDSLFDSPRETTRDRLGLGSDTAGSGTRSSGSSLFDRTETSRSAATHSREPVDAPPRPSRDWGAPAEPAPPPLRGSMDRDFDLDRPSRRDQGASSPRLDRLGDVPPPERRPASYDRPSYADQDMAMDRGYEPPRSARDYDEPEPYEPAPFDDAPYQGFHARELASVDETYAREYQYTDEAVDFRRAEPSGYEEYGQYDDQYGDYQNERKRRGPFLLLGSLIGVAAIAGGLILVYKQGISDGQNGTVPVVEAPEEPARMEPDEPGGLEVPGRTKLIYDRIIGETTVTDEAIDSREEPLLDPNQRSDPTPGGQTNPQAESGEPLPLPLPPPPSTPGTGQQSNAAEPPLPGAGDTTQIAAQQPVVPPSDPSVPSTVIQPGAEGQQPAGEQPPAAEVDPNDPIAQLLSSPPLPTDKPVPPSRQASPGTAVPTNPVEANPLPGSVPREDTQTAALDGSTSAPINLQPTQPLEPAAPSQPAAPAVTDQSESNSFSSNFADEPGSGVNFQNATPPSSTQSAPAQPVETQSAAVQPQQQVPVTGGRYVVQLASFRTEQEAQQEFQRLQERHAGLLSGYSPFIQQADLGSRGIYYRLRIGPIEQRGTASQLCNSLISAGERDCFVGER